MKRADVIALLGMLKTLDVRGFVTIDDAAIDAWHFVLAREPGIRAVDAMIAAQTLITRPGAEFPKPGDFRALVGEIVHGVPSPAEARHQVERALRENYPGQPARYTPDHLVLQAVRSIGGVTVFRASQSEQETSRLWRSFDAAYRELRDERVSPRSVPSPEPVPALEYGVAP